MWRTTLRSVAAHKLRLALSALAIVLGVAFVSGTLVFTDTLSRTFTALFSATSADVNVEPAAAFETGLAGTGASGAVSYVPDDVVQRLRDGVEGVEAVQGFVQAEGVYLLDRDGEVLDTGGAPGLGISWDVDERLSANTLVEGRGPERAGEIAVDTGAAEELGYELGDTVPVLTTGPRVEAELVGVFRFGESGGLAGASLTAFDAATAQQLLTAPGQWTGVGVLTADGATDEEVRDRVAAAVGSGYDVKTREEQAEDLATSFSSALQFFNVFLLVFAGIALFVGTFIILNTFSMLVAQRTRELALLRALGAGRGQVTRSVLGEALVLGVVGSTVGLAGGYGIATGLRALFGQFGLTLDGDLVLTARTVVWSYVVGVLVTLAAAYLPARRASRTPPVAAMRAETPAGERPLRRRTAFGTALAAVGVAGLVAGVAGDGGEQGAALVGLGTVALVLGAVALSPVLAVPFLRGPGAVLPRVWGTTGHLARQNALRSPRRTAATASALMVGLALVSAFSIVGASTSASVEKLVDDALGADFVVSTAVQQPFTTEVARRVAAVDGVDAVVRERFGTAQVDGAQQYLTALDADGLDAALRLQLVEGSAASLEDGLLLSDTAARSSGTSVGDSVELLLPNGEQRTLVVGGVFEKNQAVSDHVVSTTTLRSAGGADLDQYVYVVLADGADTAQVRAAVEEVVADYPVVSLKDQSQFKEEQKEQVGQLLLLVNALLVLSVVIAVLGIVNTLALSVVERTREIGLLRAVGMARAQLRRMVRLESVVISTFGAVLGLALGCAFGLALVTSLRSQGIEVVSVPAGRLAAFLVASAVVGVLAAVWPARRAARLRVLDAIASE
ncbi:MAG TPA: FtsX-like permease family protein [Mycobacteriales bacterium]|nr:FtsX-like permease family protein [Mycobacteriales bacterium]